MRDISEPVYWNNGFGRCRATKFCSETSCFTNYPISIFAALNAQAAESKEDFVHKMKICQKELRETSVCLKLIAKRPWYTRDKLTGLIKENDELVAIFVASDKTVTARKSNQKS